MKNFFMLDVLLLAGCSSKPISYQIADSVLATVIKKTTGKEVSYNAAHCPTVKRSCSSGNYQQWHQKSGELACACNG